ncbi:cyclophilin-like fold protein [Amorphus orientalis]|uniref:Cyclophilin TM1367-like domain-containing protein n=1 Tax=Amorphus orientalis TaxID=649198 RepID=A0AAE3VSM4_9HYPH|nr:cyclophilin-like fold protein [Amorphus orientalis]MDQ0317450.1 hypothetical protein [Amorphus orientalis]
MRAIQMTIGDVVLLADLRDTPTADAVWEALPLTGDASIWGEEVYFSTGLSPDLERDARETVEAGEVAFWPDGQIIAIGFGPTPISAPDEIRLAEPCNVFADIHGDVRALVPTKPGAAVRVEKADPEEETRAD